MSSTPIWFLGRLVSWLIYYFYWFVQNYASVFEAYSHAWMCCALR